MSEESCWHVSVFFAKGNKYFRGGRYELAIKCYSEAIELCPKDQPIDMATFHQNRAAAHDQMEVGFSKLKQFPIL